MESYQKLLLANKAWVKDRLALRSDYFEKMAIDQTPEFLWIGCSDSRVPAEEVTGTEPGEIFVHRNIANIVVHTDFNILSVIQYAVDVLKVKHIIVCGHYGCGGVKNAMGKKHLGLINKWLRSIKEVYRVHEAEIEILPTPEDKTNRLVELNVIEQVNNLSEISFIQNAWRTRQGPTLHGWVYDLKTGHLKDIAKINPGEFPKGVFELDFGV